jgi:uncharacterized protein YdeI (YjbR/CyaY-like superfamily)
MAATRSTLKRARVRMPGNVRDALMDAGMFEGCQARPPYQRNDYLGWITRAKRPETRERRLRQMLRELARGDRYMNMAWRPQR